MEKYIYPNDREKVKLITDSLIIDDILEFIELNLDFVKNTPYVYNNILRIIFDSDNVELMSQIFELTVKYRIRSLSPYIIKHQKEFEEYLKNNTTKQETIDFLMKCSIVYDLDPDFLAELYNKQLKELLPVEKALKPRQHKIIDIIAAKIDNPTPLIKIMPDSKPIHLHFNLAEKPDENSMKFYATKFSKDLNFNVFVALNQGLIEKLYNAYYSGYQKIAKPEKESIFDFVRMIMLSENNFKNVIQNQDISAIEVKRLISIVSLFKSPKINHFKNFYSNYFKEETLKWNKVYSLFVNNRNNHQQITDFLTKLNLTEETAYNYFLRNKFFDKKQKTTLIQILDLYYGKGLRVIDIVDMISEMSERELTIDRILEEKEIEKKTFMDLYQRAAKTNPALYDFIANNLKKNQLRGFKKVVRLGYMVLNSNISSLEEYNLKVQGYSFDKLLNSLQGTELYELLVLKANSWPDYVVVDAISIKPVAPINT